MTQARSHAVVFLDTNILLHFPPLAEIDWRTVCDAHAVTLFVCIEVLDEVDHKKYDSRLGSRAKRAMQRLDRHLESGSCGDRTTVSLFPTVLEQEDEAQVVSGLRADAKIVARAKTFKSRHPEEYVCVATNDLGMRLRCQIHGIPFLAGEALVQQDADDDSSHEASTVGERSSVRPLLAVQLSGQQEVTAPTSPPCFFTFPDEGQLNVEHSVRGEADALNKQSANGLTGIGKKAIEEYLDKYRAFVVRRNQRADARARQCLFTIELLNKGTAPATDIDLCVEFPDEVMWVGTEDDTLAKFLNQELTPPPRPKPSVPWAMADIGQTMAERMDAIGQSLWFPRSDGLECVAEQSDSGRYMCTIHCGRLKHGSNRRLALNAVFRSREAVCSRQLTFTLSASEITKVQEGTVPFIVRLPVEDKAK